MNVAVQLKPYGFWDVGRISLEAVLRRKLWSRGSNMKVVILAAPSESGGNRKVSNDYIKCRGIYGAIICIKPYE
jgi:hypothetical protein